MICVKKWFTLLGQSDDIESCQKKIPRKSSITHTYTLVAFKLYTHTFQRYNKISFRFYFDEITATTTSHTHSRIFSGIQFDFSVICFHQFDTRCHWSSTSCSICIHCQLVKLIWIFQWDCQQKNKSTRSETERRQDKRKRWSDTK